MGGSGCQFAAAGEDAADGVGDEDGCEGGEDGDEGGGRGAGAEGEAHSLHVARAVVVAYDGLHALRDAEEEHDGEHDIAAYDAVGSDVHVGLCGCGGMEDEAFVVDYCHGAAK